MGSPFKWLADERAVEKTQKHVDAKAGLSGDVGQCSSKANDEAIVAPRSFTVETVGAAVRGPPALRSTGGCGDDAGAKWDYLAFL